MIIDFIRHGEPVGGGRYRGDMQDDPLSDKGWRQMRSAIDQADPYWDQVISSPMIRCSAFAQEVAGRFGLPLKIEYDLREIGFGQWVGKTKAELQAERPDEFKRFYENPVVNTPEGAEPIQSFMSRIDRCIRSINHKYKNKHLLIVAHAGVIRASIALAILVPPESMYRLVVHNAGITRIEYTDEGASLVFHCA